MRKYEQKIVKKDNEIKNGKEKDNEADEVKETFYESLFTVFKVKKGKLD